MGATTIIIAVTVDGDGALASDISGRIAGVLDDGWTKHKMPFRLAQDIRVHRYNAGAIGDMLNKATLGETD